MESVTAIRSGTLSGIVPLEPEGRRLSPDQVAAYLDRLGVEIKDVRTPTLEALTLLQMAHCDCIAYENLDLHTEGGFPTSVPTLSPHASAERMQQRGSYCFLLVDAFAALLCSLGFRVSMHTAGVGDDPLPNEKWGNHILLLAHLNDGRTFVADVGLGDGPCRPFELKSGMWEENGYYFRLDERKCGVWHFTHDSLGSFKGFDFDLSTSAAGAHEFTRYHEVFWTDPHSPFRECGLVLQRMSPSLGIVILRNCTLKNLHPSLPGGFKVLTTADNEAQLFALVHEYFFLSLDALSVEQRASLWMDAKAHHDAWLARRI